MSGLKRWDGRGEKTRMEVQKPRMSGGLCRVLPICAKNTAWCLSMLPRAMSDRGGPTCRYHWKSDELKASNPSGLVPTLIDKDGRAIFESLVCIDFVDAVSGASGKDCLVSEDPVEAARARVWADRVNRECCSPYYSVLVRTDDVERANPLPTVRKKQQLSAHAARALTLRLWAAASFPGASSGSPQLQVRSMPCATK
jgi:hypothetical protein